MSPKEIKDDKYRISSYYLKIFVNIIACIGIIIVGVVIHRVSYWWDWLGFMLTGLGTMALLYYTLILLTLKQKIEQRRELEEGKRKMEEREREHGDDK